MFIAAFFMMVPSGSNSNVHQWAFEWTNKTWHMCRMKYYLTMIMNDLLKHATTGMILKNIMLSERRPKRTYMFITFIRNIQSRQIHTDRKCITGC
jgi:hypothetical protein